MNVKIFRFIVGINKTDKVLKATYLHEILKYLIIQDNTPMFNLGRRNFTRPRLCAWLQWLLT